MSQSSRVLVGAALVALFVAPQSMAANSVVIESKSVIKDSHVEMGVSLSNDETIQGFVIPFLVRTTSGSAFWTGGVDTLPWSGRIASALTELRVINKDSIDFNSTDRFILTGLKIVGAPLSPGSDATPSITLTYDVTNSIGTFEFDTLLYPVASYLTFVSDATGLDVLPEFTKGVITVSSGPCPTGSWDDPGPVDGIAGDNLSNSISAQLPPDGPGTTILYNQLSGPGSINAGGNWSWSPACNDIGPYLVEVEVTDDAHEPGECQTISFGGTISEPPVGLSCGPTLNVHWGQTGVRQITAGTPCGPVTFTRLSGPGSLAGDTWSWQTACLDLGTYAVEIEGEDALGNTAQCSFGVNVSNTPPTCGPPNPNQFVAQTPIDVQLPGTGGGDGDGVTFNLVSGPAFISIDAFGQMTGNTVEADTGTYQVCVEVDDGCTQNQCCFDITIATSICECYLHGDQNLDGVINVVDLIASIDQIFRGKPIQQHSTCPAVIGDVYYQESEPGMMGFNVIDMVYLLDYIFYNGRCPIYPCTGEELCQQ